MAARIRRHEGEGVSWEAVRGAPHAALRGHVIGYTGYRERTDGVHRRRELPSTRASLILGWDAEMWIAGPGRAAGGPLRHRAFVTGLHDTFALTEYEGVSAGVQVELTPVGMHRLTGVPMRELSGPLAVEVDDVLGPEGGLLAERLALAPSWGARFALLDDVLGARLAGAPGASPDVAWAWRRLRETGGTIGMGALARELRCSPRHLGGRFAEEVGLPPKTIARLVRFHRALALLERDDGARGAEVAQACGFYDQAHLNRDFRAFAGGPPSDVLARRLPEGFGVSGR